MPQTIVIGIGGTGLDVIRCLRRRIVENHGSLEAFPHLRFLFIDTDATSVELSADTKKRWQVLGKDIFLGPAEYCIVSVREPGAILRNLSMYQQVEPWFPASNLEGIEQTARNNPGASQIRPLGRLGFIMNAGAVEARFKTTLGSIPLVPGGGMTHVYVACSLSGGTGSGTFLDLAYRIRRWTAGNCETYGFLVLPSMTENRGDRYLANAYAALLELNYYSLSKALQNGKEQSVEFRIPLELSGMRGAPFDNCYLISPRNSAPVTLSLDGLAEMIAHRLYLNLDNALANDAAGLMSNARPERAEVLRDPFSGSSQSQNFSTFGLSSIQYPINPVIEILAYKLAGELFYSWLRERATAPQNVNQQVTANLSELWLSEAHNLGDFDLFRAGNDYPGIPVEVKAFVTKARQEAVRKRLASFMSERYNTFATQFRNSGVTKYYQGLLDNLNGATNVLAGRVRKKIAAQIVDRELGYPFASLYLDELLKLLNARAQEYARRAEGLPAKLSNSREALNGALNQLNEADNSLLFHERKVQDAMQRVCQAMEANLIALAESAAYNYGRQLLGSLDTRLKGLRDELAAWRDALEKLRHSIGDEIRGRQEFLGRRVNATSEFNGTLLFQTAHVDAVYSELNLEQAAAHIIAGLLGEEMDPLAALAAAEHAGERAYELAIDWLEQKSVFRVATKNVADRLLEEYPDSRDAERIKLLSDARRNSMPFLDFDETEKTAAIHDTSVGYRDSSNKHASLVALMSDEQNKYPAVARVREMLASRVGFQQSQLKLITDTSEILFLYEDAAFPMRLIRDLRMLREAYQKLLRDTKPLPLHIQKEFNPPLQNLFLTSDDERRARERAEEHFLIGWVQDSLRLERNPKEEREEVRYRFRDSGADKYLYLGMNWDDAFQTWMEAGPEMDSYHLRMAEETERFRESLDTQAARRAFSNRLAAHLDRLRSELPFGEENERYQRWSSIRGRIFNFWRLPEPDRTGTATSGGNS